ncbi:V-type proton ATPase subunit G 2 isoform X1 [Ursus americanus]|uniref:V-type proton ATPase subunit G 2 isoform X1 n=2 Tax=Ursus americanus TaxID=9643 RepID=UPI001E67D3D9|nr:V-type proton ATPase subunit G 2 isoform X1 [Ursus americanus]
MGGSVWGRHLVQEAVRKRGALRPRGSGGLQQGAGGRGEVGGKARRLKQAKEEAQMEVEQYRREREQEFQSKQQAAMGSQGNLSAEVEQATRRQVQGMQSSQQRNRERVLAQLLGMVCDVRPRVHPNYRIAV